MTRAGALLLALAALPVVAALGMYALATSDPVVRQATIEMAGWPLGVPPMRVALLTDIHVAGPDMPPTRLARIVDQVNGLDPDLVLLGGDFVSDKRLATTIYPAGTALAPLTKLRARYGTLAVLGNHDHWRNASDVRAALSRARVRILDNEAVSVGPLRLGGVDDDFTNHANLGKTLAAIRSGPGSRVLLSHSPDVAPSVPEDVSLVLAGHTHCGQIRLPVIGAISYESRYGDRYSCGIRVEGSRRVVTVTSAGLGTSLLPLRLGAAPDLWLLTLGARSR